MKLAGLVHELKLMWPLLLGVLGELLLFIDFGSSVYCPLAAREWNVLSLLAYIVLGVALLAQMAVTLFAFARKWSIGDRWTVVASVVIFIFIGALVWQREEVYGLGGSLLIRKAGGADGLRNDSLAMLARTEGALWIVPEADYPSSIRGLGPGTVVLVDGERKLVDVKLPLRRQFGAQLGLLVQKGTNQSPYILEMGIFKAWKLADGLHLYQAL